MDAMPGQAGTRLARAVLIVLLSCFVIGGMLQPLLRPYAWSDFVTFYAAAHVFAAGSNPYDPETLRAAGEARFAGWVGRYFYPPPFAAVCIRPLLLFPFEVARRLWVVVESAAYLVALVLLARLVFGNRRLVHVALMGVAVLPYAPMLLDLKLGSVSGLLLLLSTLFLVERAGGRRRCAAAALGAAILLKLSPALVALYVLGRGEWKLARDAGLAIIVLAAACLPWTGAQIYAHYVTAVLPHLFSAGFSWFTNQSFDGFFCRLFASNPDTTPWLVSPALHKLGALACGIATLAGLAALAWRERRTARRGDWGPALALVAGLLTAPVTWEYMLVLALPLLGLWMGEAAAGRLLPRQVAALVLAYGLCALPLPYADEPQRQGWGLLLASPRLYGVVLLYVTSLVHAWRRAAAPS